MVQSSEKVDEELEALRVGFAGLVSMPIGECVEVGRVAFWRCKECPNVHSEVDGMEAGATLSLNRGNVDFCFLDFNDALSAADRDLVEIMVIGALLDYARSRVMH